MESSSKTPIQSSKAYLPPSYVAKSNQEAKKKKKSIIFSDRVNSPKEVPVALWHELPSSELFTSAGDINIASLMGHLKKEGRVAKKDFLKILQRVKTLFRKEANLLKIQDPVTVCGDVHGQFFDLLKLFNIGGSPKDNPYLFLGDYVDRGMFGTECILLLFSYKIMWPSNFHMIRGNHECRHLSSYFNFKDECLFKYDEEVYNEIMVVFDSLPLGAILNERFLCVHGGISPNLNSIDEINTINRFKEPPSSGLFCDLLWSDPMDEEEENTQGEQLFVPNRLRGCSFCYSHKAVSLFLSNNRLLSVIRAHEAQDNGYKLYKKGGKTGFPSVICVFSAPNYCDIYNNKAAVIRFDNNLMNIRQFHHSQHPYYLPNFMNTFNWSLPFVIEKSIDVLKNILNIVVNTDELSRRDKERTIETDRTSVIQTKIKTAAKYKAMMSTLIKNADTVKEIKKINGGVLPRGYLPRTKKGLNDALTTFKLIKMDEVVRDRRPPLKKSLHQMTREDFAFLDNNLPLKDLKVIKQNQKKEKKKLLDEILVSTGTTPNNVKEAPKIQINEEEFE